MGVYILLHLTSHLNEPIIIQTKHAVYGVDKRISSEGPLVLDSMTASRRLHQRTDFAQLSCNMHWVHQRPLLHIGQKINLTADSWKQSQLTVQLFECSGVFNHMTDYTWGERLKRQLQQGVFGNGAPNKISHRPSSELFQIKIQTLFQGHCKRKNI